MQVLRILSWIWKSGADIYLDKEDDRIAIKNQNLIPKEVMEAAEQDFQKIDKWFKSWKDATSENLTLRKIVHHFCCWERNEQIENWLCAENDSLMLFHDWSVVLAKNGWNDIYEDYRQFENDESNKLAHELYIRAVTFAKKGA